MALAASGVDPFDTNHGIVGMKLAINRYHDSYAIGTVAVWAVWVHPAHKIANLKCFSLYYAHLFVPVVFLSRSLAECQDRPSLGFIQATRIASSSQSWRARDLRNANPISPMKAPESLTRSPTWMGRCSLILYPTQDLKIAYSFLSRASALEPFNVYPPSTRMAVTLNKNYGSGVVIVLAVPNYIPDLYFSILFHSTGPDSLMRWCL